MKRTRPIFAFPILGQPARLRAIHDTWIAEVNP